MECPLWRKRCNMGWGGRVKQTISIVFNNPDIVPAGNFYNAVDTDGLTKLNSRDVSRRFECFAKRDAAHERTVVVSGRVIIVAVWIGHGSVADNAVRGELTRGKSRIVNYLKI